MHHVRHLKTIIQHWIKHNESHLEEYRKWEKIAISLGYREVSEKLSSVLELVSQANVLLREALDNLPTEI